MSAHQSAHQWSAHAKFAAFAIAAAGLFVTPALAAEQGALRIAAAHRQAPDFVGISQWLNSGALHIADLRGKVVVVNFWTYGCYNCVNTLPHVVKLYEKYKDRGFVVIGVHTPEFPFERSTSNVQTAIKRHGIRYPVALDNGYATWKSYSNQYWPAQYIVDRHGNIVFSHAGEGAYDTIDRTVQRLLGETS